MDIFEESLISVLEMNCILEGVYNVAMMNVSSTPSKTSDRLNIIYLSTRNKIKNYDEDKLKKFEEDLAHARDILKKSKDEYIAKSTFKQMISEIPLSIRDCLVSIVSRLKGELMPESGMKQANGIITYSKCLNAVQQAIDDHKKKMKKKGGK